MILARAMKTSRVRSLAIRSSSRRRSRSSTSWRPWCLSGGGRSDLASTAKSSTRSDSSPRLERNDAAVDADQVAEIERQQPLHPLLAEDVGTRLQLDSAGAVDEVEERHLALAAARGEPPGDAVARLGLLAVGEIGVLGADRRASTTPGIGVREGSIPSARSARASRDGSRAGPSARAPARRSWPEPSDDAA